MLSDWRELVIVGARVYQRSDFETVVELLHDGHIPTEPMISRVVALDDVADAFDALTRGSVVKVLVDCRAA